MTRERTRIDSTGTHTETVTDYMATATGCARMAHIGGRPVRFTATDRDSAERQALEFFGCNRSALTLWEA